MNSAKIKAKQVDKFVTELIEKNQELKEEFTTTLKKNNKTLKSAINKIDNLKKENEKLKKAIKILKERGGINVFISHLTNKLMLNFANAISCVLEPKDYNLLKEVLSNDDNSA